MFPLFLFPSIYISPLKLRSNHYQPPKKEIYLDYMFSMEAFNPLIGLPCIPYAYPPPIRPPNNPMIMTSFSTGQWMDTRIWSRLPTQLVDRVIAFLPPPAFFRARSVCKRWYSLLFSNTFLQLYLHVSPRHHFFLFFKQKNQPNTSIYRSNDNDNMNVSRANEAYLFDPQTLKWHRISFPLVPTGFSPVSSSGGLICWASEEAGSKSLLLSNPLFESMISTPIPSTLRPRLFPSIGLTITNSSIDVIVAGDDLISPYAVKNLTTESFHIDAGGFYSLWGTTSSLPRLCSLESGRMVYVPKCHKFYCMNYSPFSVLGYDIATNHWNKIQAPMRRFLRSPTLVESNGKLVLVAAVEKSKLNIPKSLRLWALQECGTNTTSTTWVEIERMPQQLYMQFAEVEGGRGFNCVGNGEFVVVMVQGGSDKALLFDFERKRWVWIPPCPFLGGGGGGGSGGAELNGFAYEPRLATPVTGLLDQLTSLSTF